MGGQALQFAGLGTRARVRTTPGLASASISVSFVAVHNNKPGTAETPQQILILGEGVVPQPRVQWPQLVRLA